MTLDEILERLPSLERPVVLLESGRTEGRTRLAWGARQRIRLSWDEVYRRSDLLKRLPRTAGTLYGAIAYDAGLPPNAIRRKPLLEQPVAELFVPEHEEVLEGTRGTRRPAAPHVPGPATGTRLLKRSFTEAAFVRAVGEVRDHIARGDVYQVNLSVAERYAVSQAPWDAYLRLREINPSPWMGFADFGDWQLVSGSPELLVEKDASGLLRTRPIAGTRKKTGNAAVDDAMRRELVLDAKEQAEHRMLVDLARNDLGRVAEFGSVRVREREVVEEYSHVFHLVSEVGARVSATWSPWEIFGALFPGGTITGTPKIRAMEIIAELEPVARGMYTGALGWAGVDEMQFNILIRSAVMREGQAVVQAGAGIVWDSDPAREWRESLRKGAAMREAIGADLTAEPSPLRE